MDMRLILTTTWMPYHHRRRCSSTAMPLAQLHASIGLPELEDAPSGDLRITACGRPGPPCSPR